MRWSHKVLDRIRAYGGYRFPRMGRLYKVCFDRLPPHMDVELFPGIRVAMNLRDETQQSTFWKGPRFEKPTPRILAAWGRNGASAFFDIGSNYGFFSYWMCWQCPTLDVYAFDPHPENLRIMEETRKRNRLDRFHPVGTALGDVPARRALRHGDRDSGHSTFGDHPHLRHRPSSEADIVPFDLWRERQGLALPGTPAWIAKIDVEGYEVKVLKGMETALRSRAFRGLVVEINPFTLGLVGHHPGEIPALLREYGYCPSHIHGIRPAASLQSMNAFFEPAEAGERGRSAEG